MPSIDRALCLVPLVVLTLLAGCVPPDVPPDPNASASASPQGGAGTATGTIVAPAVANVPSSQIAIPGNLDARVPTVAGDPPNYVEGLLSLFDARGAVHCVHLRFTHTATDTWSWSLSEPGVGSGVSDRGNPALPLVFVNGQLSANHGGISFDAGAYDLVWGGAPTAIALHLGQGTGSGALTQLPAATQLFLLQDGRPASSSAPPPCSP